MKKISLIAIGNELTTGSISDTNCAFISRELNDLAGGELEICEISVIPDNIEVIVATLRRLASFSDLIVTSGGLGPTSDDITRDAVALFLGKELKMDTAALQRLEDNYRARNIPLNKVSPRQAMFPSSAHVLVNPVGTADCFSVEVKSENHTTTIISLPGVPTEFKRMYQDYIIPWVQAQIPASNNFKKLLLKFFGLTESHIGTVIEGLALPTSIEVAYRASFPEIQVKLSGASSMLESAKENIIEAVGKEFLFTTDPNQRMADSVGSLLEQRSLRLAVAESCTAGMIASSLVDRAGASKYFLGSVVAYDNIAKTNYLSVGHDLLERVGAVSAEVAQQMAESVRYKLGADLGLAVTGIAGPASDQTDKAVGTLWIGLATPEETITNCYHLPYERNRYRSYASTLALDLVRRYLFRFPLTWERR
jgi:nicotinamide-nucleotide amidase